MANTAQAAGAKIYSHTAISNLQNRSGRWQLTSDQGRINADQVLLCTNAYTDQLYPGLRETIVPVISIQAATEPLSEERVREINPKDVAFADSRFVVNYYRLSADKRLLFGGGENYSTSFPRDIESFVRKPMLEIYPQLADTRIDYAWGGTLAVTLNRMPHFGRLGKHNTYFAQGYSGHGVAMATLSGKLIAAAIAGEAEKFDLFGKLPTRSFPGGDWLRWPALVLGMSYYAIRDRL